MGLVSSLEMIPFTEDPIGSLYGFLIPSLILGTGMAAGTMRLTRTMMLEVLRQDYIRTAWSKGLKERVVITRHATKNALIPVVTGIGLQLPCWSAGRSSSRTSSTFRDWGSWPSRRSWTETTRWCRE